MPVDEQVLERLAAGDHPAAVTLAMRTHGPAVLRYLRGLLGDEDLACDAFSDFAERLLRGLPQLRRAEALQTFAYRLAWCAAAHVRSAAWQRHRATLDSDLLRNLVHEAMSTPLAEKPEARDWLAQVRESLDPIDRTILLLRGQQGLPWREVTEVLRDAGEDVSEQALRKRFERLQRRLREEAGKRFNDSR